MNESQRIAAIEKKIVKGQLNNMSCKYDSLIPDNVIIDGNCRIEGVIYSEKIVGSIRSPKELRPIL